MADKPKTATEKQKERSDQIEAQIRESEKRRQERQFLEELAKRISIAREGRTLIERRNYPAAMAAYRRFLSITARSFNVEVEDLAPTQFDEKSRVSESLIISLIFFDLLKILDKLDSESAVEERRMYHRLFIRFTKGMPFQHFAAENIRRHLVYAKTIQNKNEFWATHKAIAGSAFCIVASWAFDSSSAPQVERLRRFRSEVLWPTRTGRAFTRWYYRNGQKIVGALAPVPGSRRIARAGISAFLRFLDS
jgi:hypothetical protein